MASSIVSSAARLLGKLLVEEAKHLYDVKDKVEALHDELAWMQTFLLDADTREDQDDIIRMWVSQIRDSAYEAEDIVENYLHRVSSHRQDGIWNALKWFSCNLCDVKGLKALHGVGSDIDRMKLKISELSTRMQIYGVKPTSVGNLSQRKRVMELRRTTSHIVREEIVGLKEDTEKLVDKLANSHHKVVCITGMGGLGKTTLAQMVYLDAENKFDNRVWVYVSQQFQTRNILEAILYKLRHVGQFSRSIKDLRDEELPSEVCKVLKDSKCLVVLDDVWKEQAWDILSPAFRTLAYSDSKLLLTTRNTKLLSHVDKNGFHHPAKPLSEEESWKLLKKISFRGIATSGVVCKSDTENVSCPTEGHIQTSHDGDVLTLASKMDSSEGIVCKNDSENVSSLTEGNIGTSHDGGALPLASKLDSPEAMGITMEELGKQMAKQCDGLPLAIAVLGGILATKSSLGEWKKVRDNIAACLKNGTSNQVNLSIAQVLELSFDDLPYYLKPCFLHLGNFPEDFEIPTKTLYDMWEVEGIAAQPVSTTAEVSVESIAEDYLKELGNRCLVQLDSTGKTGKINSCRLHDLIRDMCLEKAKQEKFLKLIEHGDLEKQSSSSSSALVNQRFRRLAVYMHKNSDQLQDLISSQNVHHIRSLLFFPVGEVPRKLKWSQGTASESLNLIRVLHFDNICIRSLPNEIGDLIHLRYLSLKGTKVRRLPSSVGNLSYLMILDLRVSASIGVIIPNVIWKLERLKHLFFPNEWKAASADSAKFLPSCLSIGRKLRLRGLIQLETLENLRLEECIVEDLAQLAKLQTISLADYVVTEIDSLESFVRRFNTTEGQVKRPLSLKVDGTALSKEPSILSSDSQLQFHILHISGRIMLSLGDARIFPQDLKQLSLNNCKLQEDPMPVLENLFHLTELTLGEYSFSGTKMACSARNFPKLTILRLVLLENLEEWTVEEEAMPGLNNLYIYSCKKLAKVPSELPINVKIGCRPCIDGFEKYGQCCCMTQEAAGS